jgi:hypothetical protein
MWKKAIIVQFEELHSICMEELNKTMRNLSIVGVLAKF